MNVVLMVFMFMHKAPRERWHHKKMKNRGAEFLVKKLDLTPEQETTFSEVFTAHKERKDSLERLIKKTKKELFEAAIAEDSAVAQAKIKKLQELHGSSEQELYDHLQELRKICTPEQIERLRKVIN